MTGNLRKPDIDALINSDSSNNSIIELDNYISTLCEWGDNLDALTYPQIAFYFNQKLEREVNNGGFEQYFHNSSGMYANETVETLQLIGADVTAQILQSAIDFFPNKQVPIDYDLRHEALAKMDELVNEKWAELDEKFFQYEDDLNTLNLGFVKVNRQYF